MTRQPLCLNDITVFPPPCLTADRAAEIYNPAFQRIMEYVVNSRVEGDVFEFGTFNGYTARTLAEMMYGYGHKGHLRLYDSWEGFPAMEGGDAQCPEVAVHKTWNKGDCNPIIPQADVWIGKVLSLILPDRVHTVKGFYDKTFTGVDARASIVHIDCDLYESTKLVLERLLAADALSEGAVIMFDDWNNNFGSSHQSYHARRHRPRPMVLLRLIRHGVYCAEELAPIPIPSLSMLPSIQLTLSDPHQIFCRSMHSCVSSQMY